jgi:hypothetical protein
MDLEAILRKTGPTSMGNAAKLLNRGVRYTRSLIEQFPEKFDMVGVTGNVSTWCVAIADKARTIQFVLKEK